MIGLDTNVLARYYIEDESDAEAQKQRTAAQALIESSKPLMICKTVILEFEWVMRGYYGFEREEIAQVFHHLLNLPQVNLEDISHIKQALSAFEQGLDFADALHQASYHGCTSIASFDDKKFARRVARMNLNPSIIIPSN
jgi:predicted nucleic-acid-binding protein